MHCDSIDIQILRFAMVPFGLVPSPFPLGGVIVRHLQTAIPRLQYSVR